MFYCERCQENYQWPTHSELEPGFLLCKACKKNSARYEATWDQDIRAWVDPPPPTIETPAIEEPLPTSVRKRVQERRDL